MRVSPEAARHGAMVIMDIARDRRKAAKSRAVRPVTEGGGDLSHVQPGAVLGRVVDRDPYSLLTGNVQNAVTQIAGQQTAVLSVSWR